jgi:hypothetical protein
MEGILLDSGNVAAKQTEKVFLLSNLFSAEKKIIIS